MRSRLATILMLIAIPGLCFGQARTPKEIFNSASKSIVVIVTGDANGKPLLQGSGVVFGDGLVVTNCHVLEGAYAIVVETLGKTYTASRLRNDKDQDLCSLAVTGLFAPKVQIGSVSNLSVGDKVFAIGAPRGLELTFTDGLVSSIRDGQLLQTTAAISPGSSGGGLFDEYGRLVGITTLTFKDSQGLNFAVPVEWATALTSDQSGVAAIQDKPEEIRDRRGSSDVAAANAAAAWADAVAVAIDAGYGRFEIESASLGRMVGTDNKVVSEVVRFGTSDTIHASVATNGIGGKLSASWYYQDGQTVDTQYMFVFPGPQVTDFSVSKPDGWPAGKYYLRLSVNDKTVRELDYVVGDSSVTRSDRWLLAYEDSEKQDHIDIYTARSSGDAVIVWERWTYFQPTTYGGYKDVAQTAERSRYDCAARTFQSLNSVLYSKTGEILATDNNSGLIQPVLPESVGEVVLNMVCSSRAEFPSN